MENLSKKPAKGILKNSSSIEKQETLLVRQHSQDKDLKWDEMNILQTLHPPDKDYGHMKIEEPKTPFSYYAEDEDGEVNSDNEVPPDIDPDNLAELITRKTQNTDSKFTFDDIDDSERMKDDQSESEELTEEDQFKTKEFEQKRKKHYNEFQMVKLARKLMKEELDEEEEEDEGDNETMQDDAHCISGTD